MLLEAAILNSAGNAMFLFKVLFIFWNTIQGNDYAILDTTTLVFIYKHSIFLLYERNFHFSSLFFEIFCCITCW